MGGGGGTSVKRLDILNCKCALSSKKVAQK